MNEVIKKEFTQLKIHTQYSICEGALRTLDLAKYCKINKVKAVGLCDSNNLCAALEFSESIAKSKTQPIIGTQINIQYKGNRGKIPLFAKNLEGYKNLIKLSSKSFLEIKDNEEPHCKIEDLEANFKGLILFVLQYFAKSEILSAPSQIEYCVCIFRWLNSFLITSFIFSLLYYHPKYLTYSPPYLIILYYGLHIVLLYSLI